MKGTFPTQQPLDNTDRFIVGVPESETESEVGGLFGNGGRGWTMSVATKFHSFLFLKNYFENSWAAL
jgi:hypothetical protein